MALVKTRIKQKFETLTQWKTVWERFTPLAGEIIVFNITTVDELSQTPYAGRDVKELPFTITRTGTGTKTLAALPWDVETHTHEVSFTITPKADDISAPVVTIDPTTKTIPTITDAGSLPELEIINFNPGSYKKPTYTKGTWISGSYTAPDYTEPVYTAPSIENNGTDASNIWSDAVYTSATQTLKIGQSSFNAGVYVPGVYNTGELTFPSYTEPSYVEGSYTAPSLSGGTFNPGTLPTIANETVVTDISPDGITVGKPTFKGKTESISVISTSNA